VKCYKHTTLQRNRDAKKPPPHTATQTRRTPLFTEKSISFAAKIAAFTSFYHQLKKYFPFFILGIENISTFAPKL